MKTITHAILCFDGVHEVTIDIHKIDPVEAMDIWGLGDAYSHGGYRIEGRINGILAGMVFSPNGWDSERAARAILSDARRDGLLPAIPSIYEEQP